MSDIENKEDVRIIFFQEAPSVIEVYPLSENFQLETFATERFGVEGHYKADEVRRILLDLEKQEEKLKEVPSDYPPILSSSLYDKLGAKFLIRLSARRYREKDRLKTYAMDIGVMNKRIYLFLAIEEISPATRKRIVKLAPLSSVEKAPDEWLEGISPVLLQSLSPTS